jgi:hypothetical protein
VPKSPPLAKASPQDHAAEGRPWSGTPWTADHGEWVGKDGSFGHEPATQKKGFEVPFLQGKVVG